nr:hypothetical protein [Streptomyces harenosi]
MYRATQPLASVTYRYSHTTYHPTEQTLGFWEFLDRTHGDLDYGALSEEEIGDLYVAYRAAAAGGPGAAGPRARAEALRPYAEAVEDGWVHPASTRILHLWSAHYAALGLHDPGLLEHQPPGLTLDETLARLDALGMILDLRGAGGPVYLDHTRAGLPLRQLVTADGRPNYLACALRELMALAPGFDEVVLVYDTELDPDYRQLARVLTALGPAVRRVPVGRVPIEGRIRSARHGGWRDHHAGALLTAAYDAGHDAAAVHLGMRLYFIAVLGPGHRQSFRADLLHQCLRRAERMLERARYGDESELAPELARHRKDHLYVDPYRLTSSLLGRRNREPAPGLLTEVFL